LFNYPNAGFGVPKVDSGIDGWVGLLSNGKGILIPGTRGFNLDDGSFTKVPRKVNG